jgi:hypothetical protein
MKELVDEIVECELTESDSYHMTVWFKNRLLNYTNKGHLQVGQVIENVKDTNGSDFYLFAESCSHETSEDCPILDRWGLCCWVVDGDSRVFKARYSDYPF